MRRMWLGALVMMALVAANLDAQETPHAPRSYLFQYVESPSIAEYERAHGSIYRHEPWMSDERWQEHRDSVLARWPEHLERLEALQPDVFYMASNSAFMLLGLTEEDMPTPEEIRAQMDAQRAELEELRARGVDDVGFYRCAVTMRGNAEERHGIFGLYDRWEEYAEVFNLGPKPEQDPMQWLQIRFDSGTPYIRAWDRPDPGGNIGYMCCPNNPAWRQFSQAMVHTGAQIGYTNLFVDNPSMFCKCDWCRKAFSAFQRERFTEEEWQALFPDIPYGEGDIEDDRLIAERTRFWQDSIGRHLASLKEAMRRGNPGAKITLSANGARLTLGPWYTSRPNLAQFAAGGVDFGFKESPYEFSGLNLRPVGNGLMAIEPGNIFDGYRLAHAAAPDYYASPAQYYGNLTKSDQLYRLAFSEALALDGCYLDGARLDADLPGRDATYSYVRRHREFFAPGQSVARVVVILGEAEYYFDEAFYADAFRDTQVIRDWLDDAHIPFDTALETALSSERLARYEVAILPGFKALDDATAEMLGGYVAGGGALIVSGQAGTHHPAGPVHDAPALAGLLSGANDADGLLTREMGEGRVVACSRRFADADLPEGYSMTGYTISRPQTMGGKTRGPLEAVAVEANRELFARALALATEGHDRAPLQVLSGAEATRLRVAGRGDLQAEAPWLTLHLVNEDLPMRFADTGGSFELQEFEALQELRDVRVLVPLPEGLRARSLQWAAVPLSEPAPLEFTPVRGGIECVVPRVEMYSVLRVELEPGEAEGLPVAVETDVARRPVYVTDASAPALERIGGEAAAAPTLPLRLNFTHPALIFAEAGDQVRVQVAAHGPDGRWARWWIADPQGSLLDTGGVPCGGVAEAAFTPAGTGVYLLQAQAGAHDVSYSSATHGICYPADASQRLGFTGATPDLHFFVPQGAEEVPLMLQTRDREGVFEVLDADGHVLAKRDGLGQAEVMDRGGAMVWSDKSSGSVYQRVAVPVAQGQAGRVWTLRFTAGSNASIHRSNLYFADDFPGYVATDPAGLLRARE